VEKPFGEQPLGSHVNRQVHSLRRLADGSERAENKNLPILRSASSADKNQRNCVGRKRFFSLRNIKRNQEQEKMYTITKEGEENLKSYYNILKEQLET